MKKVLLIIGLVILVGYTTFSCSSKKSITQTEAYYCPMECEGDKTYTDKDKLCPICDMKLVSKTNGETLNHSKK